jgi:hypothetical protein
MGNLCPAYEWNRTYRLTRQEAMRPLNVTNAANEPLSAVVLRNASFASLEGSALTPAARKLVNALNERVVAQITEYELDKDTPKTNRGKLRNAVEAFLADLLMAHTGKQPKRWVYRALRPEGFTGGSVGYRVFMPLQQALRDLDLVEHRPGVDQWTSGFGERDAASPAVVANRWAARFRATPELLKLSGSYGLPPAKASEHSFGLPKKPLQKRRASVRDRYGKKAQGKLMKFEHTETSLKLEADVRELNEYLDKQAIEGGVHRGYVRIFQNGNDPAFNWDFGGRLYSQPAGDTNYQQLKGAERRRMTLNGAPVVEIDIRASYLTIFHAWHGVQLRPKNDDPYSIQGLGRAARDIAKLWTVAAFGNTKPLKRWPKELVKEYNESHPRPLDRKRFSVTNIGEKVLAQYPLMRQWGEPFNGRVRTWADLMYAESRVVIETMQFLMRHHDIPSLAVHDALIVPQAHAELATKVLQSVFWGHLKVKPLVKINRSTTRQSRRSILGALGSPVVL